MTRTLTARTLTATLVLLTISCRDNVFTDIRCKDDRTCEAASFPGYFCGPTGRCTRVLLADRGGPDAQATDGAVPNPDMRPELGDADVQPRDARLDAMPIDAAPADMLPPPTDATLADSAPALAPPSLPAWAPPTQRVLIPEGRFLQGESAGRSLGDDVPRRVVTLSAFYVDVTEVTVAAWRACEGAAACEPPTCPLDGADHPIRCVDHAAAAVFCQAMGGRLPTEAEWERAARGACAPPEGGGCDPADPARIHPWGDTAPTAGQARFNRADPQPVTASPAGASPAGLLNLLGNVAEWTADCYDADAYTRLPAVDPANAAPECEEVVVRGGHFGSAAIDLGVSRRDRRVPIASAEVGLRCAYDPR